MNDRVVAPLRDFCRKTIDAVAIGEGLLVPWKSASEVVQDDMTSINNTSIVASMTYRGQRLLFSGDAQYGSWASWLDDPDAQEILSQVSFFKVAHHGSFNVTPRRALEALTDGHVAAMVSTQNLPWPSIPRAPLLHALDKKTKGRWVRSDAIRLPKVPHVKPPARLGEGFSQSQFWYDYVVSP